MARQFWTTLEGSQVKISKMDLGHLTNTIRMLGEKLEESRKLGDAKNTAILENNLQALQDEYDSRGEEIAKAAGLLGVLLRGANST